MRDREHFVVKSWRVLTALTLVGGVVLPACGSRETRTLESTTTLTTEHTPLPTETPIPSRTPTSTLTPTPTPDWESINKTSIETALDGETITLRQIAFNRVMVLHPPGIKDLVYGALTNEKGQTQVLFENFDCEFIGLRDKGQLGEKEKVGTLLLPADAWDVSKVLFDEVRVKKTSELPGDVEVFESESFVLSGEETICPEVPVVKPATDFARRMYDQAKEIAVELFNRLSQAKLTPYPNP